MQLNMRAFNMEEVLQTSISTIKGSADARNISMGMHLL
jgi:hypothetical protein